MTTASLTSLTQALVVGARNVTLIISVVLFTEPLGPPKICQQQPNSSIPSREATRARHDHCECL